MPHPRIPDFRKDQLKAFQPRENLRHKRPLLVLVPDSQSPPTSGMRLRQAFSAASAMPIACLQVSGLSPVSALPNLGRKTTFLCRDCHSARKGRCMDFPDGLLPWRLSARHHSPLGKKREYGSRHVAMIAANCALSARDLWTAGESRWRRAAKLQRPWKTRQAKTVRGRMSLMPGTMALQLSETRRA